MSKEEIVDKLTGFFANHDQFSEESHVVYVMVEIRKIIDQTKSAKRYPLLKFYSDWTVHSKKDVITPEIKQMAEEMYAFAVSEINAPHPGMSEQVSPFLDFAYMNVLGKEVQAFFEEFAFNSDLATNKEKWLPFVSLLVKVLENQPINSPCDNVELIVFEPANAGCVILVIVFTGPVKEYPFYRFMNAY